MEYSNKYRGRHGFADFVNLKFGITNKKDDTVIECSLIEVPEYSFNRTYREKVDEGNGWYSKGDFKTDTIVLKGYYLIVLDNECLGVVLSTDKKTLSNKFGIKDLKGLNYIKEYIKNI